MLTKKQLKIYSSLHKKKYRSEHNLFIAEGEKIVLDLLNNGMNAEAILCTTEWIKDSCINDKKLNVVECDNATIKKVSSLTTPTEIIGVFNIPERYIDSSKIENELSLVLDDIQDPGNMGTIIRTADWFGIDTIFCSKGTVDIYNPKTIQATMGAIAKLNIVYCDLEELIKRYGGDNFPVYGTFLEGENIYSQGLSQKGFIVMGNEGKGISDKISEIISHKINIPPYNKSETASESLNVAIATSIICSEFRKNSLNKI